MKKLFFCDYKQNDKYHYEIKENDIRGKLLLQGKNFPTRKAAVKCMNKSLKQLTKQFK